MAAKQIVRRLFYGDWTREYPAGGCPHDAFAPPPPFFWQPVHRRGRCWGDSRGEITVGTLLLLLPLAVTVIRCHLEHGAGPRLLRLLCPTASHHFAAAAATLAVTVLCHQRRRGILRLLPILAWHSAAAGAIAAAAELASLRGPPLCQRLLCSCRRRRRWGCRSTWATCWGHCHRWCCCCRCRCWRRRCWC